MGMFGGLEVVLEVVCLEKVPEKERKFKSFLLVQKVPEKKALRKNLKFSLFFFQPPRPQPPNMPKRDVTEAFADQRDVAEALADMQLPDDDVVFVEVKKADDVVFVEVKKPRDREPAVRAPDAPVQEVLLEPLPRAVPRVRELIFPIGAEGRCDCGFEGVCVRATAFACVSGCPVWVGTRVCRGCAPGVEQLPACPMCRGASRL